MSWLEWRWLILGAATLPSLSYLVIVLGARSFFRRQRAATRDFTPPVSILKPVRGLDTEAYENFASFCRQDYPQYEILFAVPDEQDAAVPVIRRLIVDFPSLPIRLIVNPPKLGANDKVNKLAALARAARHDLFVLSDADIRVAPAYLRSVAAPLRDPQVGATSALFTGISVRALWPEVEAIYLSTDFMPSILLAQQVEGVHFAMGGTIAVTRERLQEIGGFEALADEAADDYELGFRIAKRGYRIELVEATVSTWCTLRTFRDFYMQRLRWAIMARQSRPFGYAGLIFTQGLPWTVLAAALAQTPVIAAAFVAAYVALRAAMVGTVAVWGLRDDLPKRRWWLVPLWDALGFAIWLNSLLTNRVRWQGIEYRVSAGRLVPIVPRG